MLTCFALGTAAAASGYDVLNVTDFGAVPNDNKDDTDAIEKAIAASRRILLRPNGGSYVGIAKAVYFPPGVYDISRTVECHKKLALISDPGKAMIRAVNIPGQPPLEIMFKFFAYTNSISNLKFIGGKTQLYFTNPNINQTTIEIDSCEFQHASGTAIRAVPDHRDHLSALLTIRNCKFLANNRCLETYCDYTVINDCWVETSQPSMDDGPVFINRAGHLIFDRFMGIPCADRSKGIKDLENCRWVDNYDTFTAVNSRFGAEGAGIPVIYQYEPPKLYYPSVFKGGSVDIQSCHVFTGSQRRKNACVMMLFSLPQKVVFCNNTGPVNNAIFRYAPGFDPAPTLLQLKKSGRDKFVNYVIGWNICMPVPLQETVPEELKQFVRH